MQLKDWLVNAKQTLAKRFSSGRLDAEVIAASKLNKPRSYLYAHPEHELTETEQVSLESALKRRMMGEPVAYITGWQEFYSLPFRVTQDVLIPRADSELLIEESLAFLHPLSAPKILDLGTGSGALALTLAKHRPDALISAVDKSEKALEIANQNKALLELRHVTFLQSDWFSNVPSQEFDLIIANPPYIAEHCPHLEAETRKFEPISALISDEDGLSCLRKIISQSPKYLKAGGMLIVEHGFQQAKVVGQIFASFHYKSITYHKDLAEKPRAISGTT
jgi:release factor glutamine methyltransferase